ncbi:selenocysteine-specific translation elongation factor [Roseibacillus ishigakijimensis]|uniref:Selenocysteine-specific translation elongation factor n=1 Tax=Roseibacillus ishigakijimensis TaxID=454146 RepID=A0A934RKC2_9BACT|nr:selenocysteine-specific translation elongation factor [Roseibacillus ishigakijimensis]MBK1833302.1 selenocysteine-specific translation elongation factor [Roseibacillus ishigakijimensis]
MNFILGTAGHIDHGKSSLVQALTGTNPDRLPEEQKRGVTIELGFAHLALTGPDGEDLQVGVVDVPGHADFVNNMVAGVGALDLALIVVAADDGWMPQSEEHLHILSYLGVTRAVIALSKVDLAEDAEFAVEFVRDALQGSAFAESPIVPVSAHTGEGIAQLRETIARTLATSPTPEDLGVPLLPVDRAFSVKGIGTIITGTLSRGALSTGDRLLLQPQGLPVNVRGIQNHNTSLEQARPGMRTAVNIPDVAVDSRKERGVKRGQILTQPEAGHPSDTLDVALTRLARPIPAQPGSERVMKNNQKVRLHHGSGRVNARVSLLEGELAPGQSGLAQLRLEEPLFTFSNDHIVIRDWSGEATLAGARVLDAHGSRRHLGKEEHQTALRTLAAENSPAAFLRYLLHKRHFLPGKPAPQDFPYSNRSFKDALRALQKSKEVARLGNGHVASQWWESLLAQAQSLVTAYHEENPDLPGLPLQTVRRHFAREFARLDLFPHLLESLAEREITNEGDCLKALSHRTDIPPELADEAEAIMQTLAQEQLQAPNRKELAPTPAAERALAFLIRVGKVISLDEKTVLAAEAVTRAAETVRSHLQDKEPATASELRQVLDTSRRIAMPLLEHFDAQGLTRREGDVRLLKS